MRNLVLLLLVLGLGREVPQSLASGLLMKRRLRTLEEDHDHLQTMADGRSLGAAC
jgi:hypothetical protein